MALLIPKIMGLVRRAVFCETRPYQIDFVRCRIDFIQLCSYLVIGCGVVVQKIYQLFHPFDPRDNRCCSASVPFFQVLRLHPRIHLWVSYSDVCCPLSMLHRIVICDPRSRFILMTNLPSSVYFLTIKIHTFLINFLVSISTLIQSELNKRLIQSMMMVFSSKYSFLESQNILQAIIPFLENVIK